MRVVPAALLLAAIMAGPVAAQPPEGVGPVRAVRLASPVVIDGRLDEAAWRSAPAVTRFTQRDPVEGAVPSESTWVWVAYDDRALYVAARLWDSRPDSIVAHLVRRDVTTASDRFFLYLDTYHDGRSGYYFGVNAGGVLLDGTLFNDNQADASWDGVWDARVRREGGSGSGWTCEFRIPISQMRSRAGAEQVWGINFKRCIARLNEVDYLVPLSKKVSGFVSRFPDLVGFEPGRRGRNVELLPYTTGKAEYLVPEAGDPFNDGSRYTPGIGADLRAGVGNNLTLNATVNPDFGQVEVDPAVVNLSDVESYFQEKRPFFTENARIFSFGQEGAATYWNLGWPAPRFFYSRRIGRAPQGRVSGKFSDVPIATHILGAAKLTGKPSEGFDFGMLQAVTSREDARYQLGGIESRTAVEPLTYYGVVRGLKQMKGGYNGLGLLTTLAQRRFQEADDDELADAMNRQSLMAGLDGWHFLDRKKLWVLSGWAGMTRVAGTEQRMIDLQRSSLHYLQRPDAKYLGVDSTATSLTGYGARLWLNKQEGDFLFNSGVGMLSPRFDVSDVGYMSQADATNGHVGVGYKWTEPNAWRKDLSMVGIVVATGNRDGDLTSKGLYLNPTITFANDWTVNPEYFPFLSAKNDRRTRGGPLMFEPASSWWQFSFDSDPRQKATWHVVTSGSSAPSVHTDYWSLYPSVEWKPAPNFTLSVGPGLDRSSEDAQYVMKVAAPGEVPADFGGRRYVFARMDQTTVSANLRLDVSFTRNLTLQTYIQPLIAACEYGDFKELARAGSYDFVHYGRDNGSSYDPATGMVDPGDGGTGFFLPDPSFNIKSLRGNAVLRWEYRPGSVLYFVWTQDREDFEPSGDLRFGPSTRRLLDAQADDIFLVKATYYLNL